ncbi:MAG: CvpA family protein [Planctomycetota bacterium]|jgi:uncharacterized membrane protein required for colicin V production
MLAFIFTLLSAQQAETTDEGLADQALDTLGGLASDGVSWFGANGVDGVGLVLVGIFALLGLWRGLWWQAMRLVGLLGAVLAARTLSPDFSVWIGSRWTEVDPLIVGGLAWLVVFLAALAVAVLVGRLGKRLLEALQLSTFDRLGGFGAGLATGVLLHSAAVAVLLQVTPPAWSSRHIDGTVSARVVTLLGDQASVLFDSSTALALEERRQSNAGQGGSGNH